MFKELVKEEANTTKNRLSQRRRRNQFQNIFIHDTEKIHNQKPSRTESVKFLHKSESSEFSIQQPRRRFFYCDNCV